MKKDIWIKVQALVDEAEKLDMDPFYRSHYEAESHIRSELKDVEYGYDMILALYERLEQEVFLGSRHSAETASEDLEAQTILLAMRAINAAVECRKLRKVKKPEEPYKGQKNCATCRNSSTPQICNACHDKNGYAPDPDKLEGLLP